jgi:biopolymer transport protein TolR
MATAVSAKNRHRRRMMSEINVVPYIDVMLVLLIIFMVTAPMIVTGVIDLPRVGQASQAPVAAIEVNIRTSGEISIRRNIQGENERTVAANALATAVKELSPELDAPVIISAEKSVRYEHVVNAMDALQRAGYTRVGLNVRKD